jgi:ABC-type Mn2+/Zn2+ transport system ATPase subunit
VIVGVVGPCCSGKSTLVKALLERGYVTRHIAQEHSFAPSMWKTIGKADVLIYLDVSFPVAQQRRWMDWKPADLAEQGRRLRHAREHCDLYLQTDALAADDVLKRVLATIDNP